MNNSGKFSDIFCLLLRETLLKKGSPSNSLPKTFGCFILKVFGKGFGEEPFLRKVCPDKEQNFYKSTAVMAVTFYLYH